MLRQPAGMRAVADTGAAAREREQAAIWDLWLWCWSTSVAPLLQLTPLLLPNLYQFSFPASENP